MISLDSKIKEVFAHPIGHDVIAKLLLQTGKSKKLVTNLIVGNLRLKTIAKLLKKRLDADFFVTLIDLLNIQQDSQPWWKEAVFYQIYPKTFNKNLQGITAKLDYLKDLGVDAIWLSPVYDSPNDDNGYDIRDYYAIFADYGTMEDFDMLLAECKKRGLRLIMDLVVNHTSDEHEWFKQALADPDSPYRDYYILRQSAEIPNNWTSFFSGPAWKFFPEQNLWAMCLFSKKQMDLNWENPAMRADIAKMVRFWLAKGVDGFRLDVINYISKRDGLPDGHPAIGELIRFCGIEHYFYGPRLHEYLRELRQKAFDPFDAFSVGETPGIGMEMAKQLTAEGRGELDMIFSFDHLENPGYGRFDDYRYDLNYLKSYLIDWSRNFVGPSCWMSLFFENHDNPRMVSKVNPDPAFREPLAKLLAIILLTAKATPFIYQGQELGAVNRDFKGIEELSDVESIGLYNELAPKIGEGAAFAKVLAGSRDHARAPMTWDDSENAVLSFYKQMIALRKAHSAFVYGEIEFVGEKKSDYFAYYRKLGGQTFFVECNLSDVKQIKSRAKSGYAPLLSNHGEGASALRPYEGRIYLC